MTNLLSGIVATKDKSLLFDSCPGGRWIAPLLPGGKNIVNRGANVK
jgi:hypothetical protein